MAEQQVIRLPEFVGTLVSALERRLPGVQAEVERVKGADAYYYRVGLVSDLFDGTHLMGRQDIVWSVAREVLAREDLLRISMFVTLTPDELEGED